MSKQQLPISENLAFAIVIEPAAQEHLLMLKDRWHGEEDLGMRVHHHLGRKTIYFGNINQQWLKSVVKRYVLYLRSQGKSFGTLHNKVQNISDFSIFLEAFNVYGFNEIDDEILSGYLGSISRLAQSTRRQHIISIKTFLDTGTINGWFDISTYCLRGETSRVKPEKINYVPDEVLSQIDEHLFQLPEQLQRVVILFRALGLRASEIFQMPFDCLRQRQNGEWEMHVVNWKFNERVDILPIIPEIADIIKNQQTYIRTHLSNFKYLFCRFDMQNKPIPKVIFLNDFNNYLNEFARQCNICDSSGQIWNFTSHQFRRTVATKMTNEGVRQYIIQRYLRHDNPDMMQHYASIFPATIKEEMAALHKQRKIVDVTGTEVSLNHPELDDEVGLHWLRSKMQPKALAMGFCARPQLLKPCPHANACLSCEHYRLDEDDLPALKQHLERNQKLKTESERLGYVRQLKGVEEDTTKIVNLIEALENSNG